MKTFHTLQVQSSEIIKLVIIYYNLCIVVRVLLIKYTEKRGLRTMITYNSSLMRRITYLRDCVYLSV